MLFVGATEAQKDMMLSAECAASSWRDVFAERDQLRARVQELERERDAYRRAKEENDERFMLERDEARQERDAARAECERLKDEAEDRDIINNPEMKAFWEDRDILKAQIQRLEAQAARMREALECIETGRRDGQPTPDALLAAAALAETDAGARVQGLVEALQFYGREEQVLGGSDYQQHGTSSYRQSTDDGGKRAREALDAWDAGGKGRDGDGE